MNETNFASLSSGLLARKGGAKPAMRPQVATSPADGSAAHNLEDLGWNDMGDDAAPQKEGALLHLTPEPANPAAQAEAKKNDAIAEANLTARTAEKPAVVEQQEAIAARVAAQPMVKKQALPPIEAPSETADVQTSLEVAQPLAQPSAQSSARPSTIPRKRRSALARGKRAAFTLRLDADRHLKLRLACTLRNRSAQQIVTDALDQMLGDMPDVISLAKQAKTTE